VRIEKMLFATTRLETYQHDARASKTSRLATATGFFYQAAPDQIFLITNKHVLYEENSHYFPDRVRLHVHTNEDHLSKIKKIDLRLWDSRGRKTWRWSRRNPSIDIVALPVPRERLEGTYMEALTTEDIYIREGEPLKGCDICLGLQAVAFGYPLDFYDENTYLPIARTASVATLPWLNFRRKPYFLIDASLHPGMSGSPVVSSPGACLRRNCPQNPATCPSAECFLLGVFSSRWEKGELLELNNVWHASLIREIVAEEPH
jgi:hypothetical protein